MDHTEPARTDKRKTASRAKKAPKKPEASECMESPSVKIVATTLIELVTRAGGGMIPPGVGPMNVTAWAAVLGVSSKTVLRYAKHYDMKTTKIGGEHGSGMTWITPEEILKIFYQ